ncbi:MAG: hypothetical protein P8R42_05275 [Candidatus Binatia bacterium]|nr:hypothetical protein [Candidatus Binatia bacterium]
MPSYSARFFSVSVAALGVLTAALALPDTAAALSNEATCLVKMSSGAAKVAKAQGGEARRCLKARAKGDLDAAEATACLLADGKGKVGKATGKTTDTEASKCSAIPSFGFSGAAQVNSSATTEQLGVAHEIFGADMGDAAILSATDSTGASCQAAVLKATGKVVAQELKAFSKCQKTGLQDDSISDTVSLAACLDDVAADANGKIAKARAGITKALDQKCGGVDLDTALPGTCSGSGDFSACLSRRADCRACLLLSDSSALGAGCDLYDDGTANLSCIQCNGAASLCDRPFDEVSYATSHNAMSTDAEGWLAPNQQVSVPDQLDAGIRSLMLDTWYWGGDAVLCHGGEIAPGLGCDITGEKPLDVGLAELTTYLDTHPHEVLSIIFESYISEADTAADFAASGLLAHVHTQPVGTPWPTLRDLIAAGTRLVVFTDDWGGTLPWHHYVWAHAWETHFSFTTPAAFSCTPNRGSTSNALFILNHFLTKPFASQALAEMVNHSPLFIDRAEQCQSESEDLPNFVTVDFENIGEVYDVVRSMNGLP